jgi:hypothetical protein
MSARHGEFFFQSLGSGRTEHASSVEIDGGLTEGKVDIDE